MDQDLHCLSCAQCININNENTLWDTLKIAAKCLWHSLFYDYKTCTFIWSNTVQNISMQMYVDTCGFQAGVLVHKLQCLTMCSYGFSNLY